MEHGAGARPGPRPRAAQRQHQLRQVNTGLLLAGAAGILTRDWPQRVHGQVQQLVPVLPAALPRLAQPRAAEAVRPELPQSRAEASGQPPQPGEPARGHHHHHHHPPVQGQQCLVKLAAVAAADK